LAFIVEIFRKVNNKNTGIDLEIHASVWDKLLEFAEKEGWQPLGTVCPPESELNGFKNNYRPDYPDSKMVTAQDAINWAVALTKVRQKLITNPTEYQVKGPIIIREEDAEPGPGLFLPTFNLQVLDRFITYITLGEFFFWWDD
jgi:hypothetical protein